ncbi:MAG: M48 family metallopeptidase [Parcubacteria group bacterium]|nr:M48 family metallopeptidase [Parcubacteria group bacterium]
MTKRKVALLGRRKIAYTVRRNARARQIGITIYPNGSVVLTVPQSDTLRSAEAFLRAKADWVLGLIRQSKTERAKRLPPPNKRYYLLNHDRARDLITSRLEHFNEHYGFRYRDVRIKNLLSQWGSCSDKKNLNFNYRIMFLSPRLRDYVIVHELCHSAQMNHSASFWRLVEEMFPNYKALEERLGRYTLARF